MTLGKSFNAFMPSFSLKNDFIASLFQRNCVEGKSAHCGMLQGAVVARTTQVKSVLKIKELL